MRIINLALMIRIFNFKDVGRGQSTGIGSTKQGILLVRKDGTMKNATPLLTEVKRCNFH